jgi:beta-glucanase (GH16 family)/predicted GH43/DUF377 family glycosyl hydrolase
MNRTLVFAMSLLAPVPVAASSEKLPVAGDWKLAFSDEFNGKNADLDAAWTSQNGPSGHILCSRWRENATIENGTLRLLNKKEKRGGQEWTSGNIWTKRKFQYGYFEARYKYGAATGLNNSFWIMTTDGKGAGGQFEIDINEGHFPNEVNTNIHRWSGEHLSRHRAFLMGGQPSHSFSLELPIETTKLRLVVRDPGRFSVADVRVFAPSDTYPPAPGLPGGEQVKQVNLAAQAKASTTSHFQNFVAANAIDGKFGNESRWVAENAPGPNTLTLEWPQKQRIGCIQLLSGWQDGDKRQGLISDFSLEYWDGMAWTPLAQAGGKPVDFSREFQTYGLLWTEKELVWFFNGKEIRRSVNEWCHRPAPVWLSSAIIKWAGEVTDKIDGTSMDVDYVRVYQLSEAPKSATTDMNFQKAIQPLPSTARFADADYFIWCGSPIKGDDGKYHLFYSRWLKKYGFNAWVTHSEIARAVSDSPLGPYKHANVVLPPRAAAFWDGLCTHNPTVQKFGDKYYLYYMGNTGDGKNLPTLNWTHRNNQRVGVAVADKPDGPWTRFDKPLIEPTPNFYDALCLANPSVVERPGGGYLMVYKAVADKKPLPFGGPVLHCVATADSPVGPFKKEPNPVFVKEGVHFAAEDPYVWVQGGRYFAIVKDFAGHFTNAGKSLALFESPDGIRWDVSKDALVSRIEVTWQDGRVQKLNLLERPQLLIENGVPIALYCAADEGNGVTTNLQIPLKF